MERSNFSWTVAGEETGPERSNFSSTVNGDAGTYLPLWAFDDAAERSAFETLMDRLTATLQTHPDAHIYHYAPYEPAALKRLMARAVPTLGLLFAMTLVVGPLISSELAFVIPSIAVPVSPSIQRRTRRRDSTRRARWMPRTRSARYSAEITACVRARAPLGADPAIA